MILEIAQIDVKPGMEAEFEAAVNKGRADFQARQGLQVHDLCSVRMKCRSATGCSCNGKRWRTTPKISARSADFQEWRKLVGHCFSSPPNVEHVTEVMRGFRMKAQYRPHSHHPHRQPAAHRQGRRAAARRGEDPGTRKAELQAAVREAVAGVVRKQVECGLDIVNDGEQGRTDYTVHVLKRLTGYDGESAPPMGTGEPEFPELAETPQALRLAVPAPARPATRPVDWKDWPAAQADIDLAKAALAGAKCRRHLHDLTLARPDRALSQEPLLQERRGTIFTRWPT